MYLCWRTSYALGYVILEVKILSTRIIIWGTGYDCNTYKRMLSVIEDAEIIGITSNENIVGNIDGIKFIPVILLNHVEYDYIFVFSEKRYDAIRLDALAMGINPAKILRGDLLLTPKFDWEKYQQLRLSGLSIISQGCWGGIISHGLNLPFLSPTVNIQIKDNEFLKMAKKLRFYMQCDLEFSRISYNESEKKIIPVFQLNQEIEITMPHDENFVAAKNNWYRRRERINWNNLLLVMITENPDMLCEFDSLPFKKKICIVPFKSKLESALYVPSTIRQRDYWNLVHMLAWRKFFLYDILELLLHGKKISLLDMLD